MSPGQPHRRILDLRRTGQPNERSSRARPSNIYRAGGALDRRSLVARATQPLVVGLSARCGNFLAWAVPCAIRYPDAFYNVLIKRELIAHSLGLGGQFGNKHITSEGPIIALKLIWQNPLWFIGRFAPWSLAAVGALVLIGWRNWLHHKLAPAILWVFLVLLFFALSAQDRRLHPARISRGGDSCRLVPDNVAAVSNSTTPHRARISVICRRTLDSFRFFQFSRERSSW